MPFNRPQLNLRCKELFLQHACLSINERKEEPFDYFKLSIISNNFLKASQLPSSYAFGIFVSDNPHYPFEFFILHKSELANLSIRSKIYDTPANLHRLLSFLQPEHVVILINDYIHYDLKRLIGIFKGVECKIHLKIGKSPKEVNTLLNSLAPKISEIICQEDKLNVDSITSSIKLDSYLCYEMNQKDFNYILSQHKIKCLKFLISEKFKSVKDERVPTNIAHLKILDVNTGSRVNNYLFVLFLAKVGARLDCLTFNHVEDIGGKDVETLIFSINFIYQKLVNLESFCREITRKLVININLLFYWHHNSKIGDDWLDEFLNFKLIKNAKIEVKEDTHVFKRTIKNDFIDLNYHITTIKNND